jgi:hypothetical protein
MKTAGVILTIAMLVLASAAMFVHAQGTPAKQEVRFAAVDVYVDSGTQALAAYQFELTAAAGEFRIVGVEGGEHAAFSAPPYYDPAALMNDRIIIAAFNTGTDLPAGKTRVARVHVQITGNEDPQYVVKLMVAGDADGKPIAATASCVQAAASRG